MKSKRFKNLPENTKDLPSEKIENLLSSIKSEESKGDTESESTENFVLEKIKD